jgi:hypothetical protein
MHLLRKWSITLCMLAAMLLAGCQSVNGYDVDKAILSQIEVTTLEQSASFQLKIDWQEQFLEDVDERTLRIMRLFSDIDLQIHNAKTDGQLRSQMAGTIRLGDLQPIAFEMHTDGQKVLFDIEGFKQPIVMDWNPADAYAITEMDLNVWQEPHMKELIKEIYAYMLGHFPNPAHLKLSREYEKVHGEYVQLNRLHTEFDGEEAGELIVQFVNSVVQDEEGLRELVLRIMSWAVALPPSMKEQLGIDEADSESGQGPGTVTEAEFQELFDSLRELHGQLEEAKASPIWSSIFDKNIKVTADLYFDNKPNLRKSSLQMELSPAIFDLPGSPVERITLRFASENWNVNGTVDIPDVTRPRGALGPEQLDSLNAIQTLHLLEEDSVLYNVLKHEFQIDDSAFDIYGWWDEDQAPFYVDDKLYVPIRQVMDGFENKVAYLPYAKEIRFNDDGTRQGVVMHVDSDIARVNGVPVTLSGPVIWRNGYTFAPAEDLFRLLGAEYEVTVDDFDDIIVSITRDL